MQAVINNLLISRLEVRTEEDIDVRPYIHNTKLELVKVALSPEIRTVRQLYLEILKGPIDALCKHHAFWQSDPEKVLRRSHRLGQLFLNLFFPGHQVPVSKRDRQI